MRCGVVSHASSGPRRSSTSSRRTPTLVSLPHSHRDRMKRQTSRRTIFAVFPGCEILDLAGPMQAFHEAVALGAKYEVSSHALTPSVRLAQGVELGGLAPLPGVGPGDRVILPGYPMMTERVP